MRKSIFIFLLLISINAVAQDYVERQPLQHADKVYVNNIMTVTLKPYLDDYGLPIIKLGSVDKLRLDFDELGLEFTNFNYTLVHCNYDWTPSNLLKAEYIQGLQNYYIQNYEFSINTYVPYTHYSLTIPNENINFTKSGNYILVVYKNDDPNDVVLTRRFMVYENFVTVGGNVIRSTRIEDRDTKQQLNFEINHTGYDIPNPFVDLNVTVMQNGRWDNSLMGVKPKFLRNNQLDYNFEGENSFFGGNEFRNFDTKQLTELTLNVRKTVLDTNYTVFLVPEAPRNANNYTVLPDIDGRFVVRRLNSTLPEAEADYAWIDFFLKMPKLVVGDVFVFGAVSDWQVKSRFKLKYDETTQAYRGQILLKQGYFNYQYVTAQTNSSAIDETEIEGSHWETRNEYSILVYHREIGIRYDRLIGLQQLIDRPYR